MARIKYKEAIDMKVGKGRPAIGRKPDKKDLVRFYEKELKSIRDIAGQLGLHPDTIHYWLKKYGIKTRSMAKRSKLRKYKRSTLEKGIMEYGIREYAERLGVHENTLRNYLKSLEEGK